MAVHFCLPVLNLLPVQMPWRVIIGTQMDMTPPAATESWKSPAFITARDGCITNGNIMAIFTITNVVDGLLDVLFCGKVSNLGGFIVSKGGLWRLMLFSCSVVKLWWFYTLWMRAGSTRERIRGAVCNTSSLQYIYQAPTARGI